MRARDGHSGHLLDGQQRLTAFWRGMHNNYDYEDYFIYLPQFDERKYMQSDEMQVYCQSRWTNKKGSRRPVWADYPAKCFAVCFPCIYFAPVIDLAVGR